MNAVSLVITHFDDLVAVWKAVSYAGEQLVNFVGAKIGGFFSSIGTAVHGFVKMWENDKFVLWRIPPRYPALPAGPGTPPPDTALAP